MEKQRSTALVLVKALPLPTKKRGEVVCCAGVNLEKEWVRLFPVPFRALSDNQKFKRWQWIEYDWYEPKNDPRPESQRIQLDSLQVKGQIKGAEKSTFLAPMILDSTEEAHRQGQTLTLIRPVDPVFSWQKKTAREISEEKREYKRVASQKSFLGADVKALEPCPYRFIYKYHSSDGKKHENQCGDWETAATFFKWSRQYGEEKALNLLHQKFGVEFPSKGIVFAMGTMLKYPKTWTLVGILRLDAPDQLSMTI